MKVAIFRDLSETQKPFYISVDSVLERIQSGASRDIVEEIRRKVFIGESYEVDKKSLPCIVFSAAKLEKQNNSFREDSAVVEHSGFMTIDFDKCNVDLKLDQLKNDDYVYAAWVSPSGTGVRALVRIPPSIEHHRLYYTAFLDRYPDLDPTSINISRVCFESYDPDIYINEKAVVWDKRISQEERQEQKEKVEKRRNNRVLALAASMVRSSYDGEKHKDLLKAAHLLGGYIATGTVNEEEAIRLLETEIKLKSPSDFAGAQKTIRDGIEHGKKKPLVEAKKLEKSLEFLRREDGEYDFIANAQEISEYIRAVLDGTLEQGLPTGIQGLNANWVFKKAHLVWFAALDNVGKSFLVWYLAVLAAKNYGWKALIHSAENNDGSLHKKLMEFYLGKSLKRADDEELTKAHLFVKEHFKIVSSRELLSVEDFLMRAELVYDEGWPFQLLIGEPYNAFNIQGDNMYRNTVNALNMFRVFKENYGCAVWVTDHIVTFAARKKDKEGYVEVPWKTDVSEGQIKAAKADDFVILHRLINHPFDKKRLQMHIVKIKDIETGGFPTQKDDPVILEINDDYCGYTCNGRDAINRKP